MHAKHDYNPLKTAYPIDSVPPFDEEEYPDTVPNAQPKGATASYPHVVIETEDTAHEEEDLALLHKSQQAAFHQSKPYQGAQAYHGQGYEPGGTELETKISWGLMIGCAFLVLLGILMSLAIIGWLVVNT